PDVVEYEKAAFSNDDLSVLKARGYSLQLTSRNYGNMQAILQSEKAVTAASDPRGIGYARVK
ncbi:MAG TPA: gamma-glutamyltransferase, partial [Pseudomonadales bacterium]|nr:gamma-glutamyltransferase [Pseudomonadales bacterium]